MLAFSLLFHKDFYSIDGAIDDRMSHLLVHCGLLNRSVSEKENISTLQNPINYRNVDVQLEQLRKLSISYLVKNLQQRL